MGQERLSAYPFPSYDLTTATSHYLSNILGNPSPYGTPLAGHSGKTIHWKFIVEGATSPVTALPVSIQPVTYYDRSICVSNHGAAKTFTVTFADATLTLNTTSPVISCNGNAQFDFNLNHPTMLNVDPAVLSNATIVSDKLIPAGTLISWVQTIDRTAPTPDDVYPGTYTVPAGGVTSMLLSQMWVNQLISPFPIEESDPIHWAFTITGLEPGEYNFVIQAAAQLAIPSPNGTLYPYATMNPPLTINVVGAQGVTMSTMPDISTITGTPVIIESTINYGATGNLTSQQIDASVMVDALIEFTTPLPTGAKIVELKYGAVVVPLANTGIGGVSSVLLSSLIGAAAPTPLIGHDGLTDTWRITVDGIDASGSYAMTFKSIAYVGTYSTASCVRVLASDDFTLTMAPATLTLNTTSPVISCNGNAQFDFNLNHPTMLNVDPAVLSNATIVSDKLIPAGTLISWVQTIDRTAPTPDDVYPGTYTVPAGGVSSLLLSEMWANMPVSPNSLEESDPIHWAFTITGLEPGEYNFVIQAAAQLAIPSPNGTLYPYATMAPALTINVVGAQGVTMSTMPDISTITGTPVIVESTINYGATGNLTSQQIDASVMVDALIEFTTPLPTGAKIVELKYGATVIPLTSTNIGGVSSVLLSSLIGAAAPTPLIGHDGLTDTWRITVDGIDASGSYAMTFKSIAYVGTYSTASCVRVLASDDFTLTMAPATLTLNTTSPVISCNGNAQFDFNLNHPTMLNVDPAVLSNATIVSDKLIPAGTVISWVQTIDRTAPTPDDVYPGTYTVPAGGVTSMLLSQMWVNQLISPFPIEESDPIHWAFTITGLEPGEYNFVIQAAAQLAIPSPNGTLYPYATMAPALTINVVGAQGVTMSTMPDISTITGTPVIVESTINYGATGNLTSQQIDASVMVDALIEFTTPLPTGAKIVELKYGATVIPLTSTNIGGVSSVLLSSLIGAAAPTPLIGHDGLTDTWRITVDGIDASGSYAMTFKSIAYVGTYSTASCVRVLASDDFTLTMAPATLTLNTTSPVISCNGNAQFDFNLNHPTMLNVDPAVLSNATIVSDKLIPAGTVISWVQTIDRTAPTPDDVYPGTYTVPAGGVTSMLLSQMWVNQLISPFPIEESDPIHWAFTITGLEPGEYNFVIQAAAQLAIPSPNGTLYPYATMAPALTINVVGAQGVTMSTMPDISTITGTPVIVESTINYGATGNLTSQQIDASVMVDALIEFTTPLPTGAKIVELKYGATVIPLTSTNIGGVSSVLLSSLIGAAAPTPLIGHDGLIDTWRITVDGIDASGSYAMTFKSIAYVGTYSTASCVRVLASDDFTLTMAPATLTLNTTSPVISCNGNAQFDFNLNHPLMENVDPAVLSNATIVSDKLIPAGTVISWMQTIDRVPYNDPSGDLTYPGTYTVPAGGVTSLLLSEMWANMPVSPNSLEESDPIHWAFTITGLEPGEYNFVIQAAAQLAIPAPNGTLYPYATLAPALTINVVGAQGVTMASIPNISTITSTPVIIPVTVTYPNLAAQNIDVSVLTDARITTSATGGFPAGAQIFGITYQGTSVFSGTYSLAGKTEVFLSEILGPPAPTPLIGHSGTIGWEIFIDGITMPVAAFPVTVEAIAYTDLPYGTAPVGCYSVMDQKSFTVTYADVDFVYDTYYSECYPDDIDIDWTEFYPLVSNVDPARVKNDSKWEFYSDASMLTPVVLPSGTKITVLTPDNYTATSTLGQDVSSLYGSAIVTGQTDPTTNEFGYLASLQRPASTVAAPWLITIEDAPAGTYYIKVKNMALLDRDGSGYPYEEYVYDEQSFKVVYTGAADVEMSPIPSISTITSTPVIIPVSVTYPDLSLQHIDGSVLTDARITTPASGGFPVGAQIFDITYDGTSVFTGTYSLAGKTEVFLSEILGAPAPTPLIGHSGTIDWEIFIDGITTPVASFPVTAEAIAYTDLPYGTAPVCYSVMDEETFNLTFAPATFTVTPLVPTVCGTDPLSFSTAITYPAILNIDNGTGSIKADALITAASAFPAGTTIAWSYNSGLATGTYTLPASIRLHPPQHHRGGHRTQPARRAWRPHRQLELRHHQRRLHDRQRGHHPAHRRAEHNTVPLPDGKCDADGERL
jgi:hypothetical protein